jgi:hypothetical protein
VKSRASFVPDNFGPDGKLVTMALILEDLDGDIGEQSIIGLPAEMHALYTRLGAYFRGGSYGSVVIKGPVPHEGPFCPDEEEDDARRLRGQRPEEGDAAPPDARED